MDDFNYKKYSLENLEKWLHDAISSTESTPEEIIDTLKKVVREEYSYHLDKLSRMSVLSYHLGVSSDELIKPKSIEDIQKVNNNSSDVLTKEDILNQRNYYKPNDSIVNFSSLGATDTITFTSCDSNDTSPECKSSWNSFWNDDKINFTKPYVSEDGDLFSHTNQDVKTDGYSVNGVSHSKYWYEYDRNDPNRKNPFSSNEDKITKWVLPVELDGLTGDCVVTLPDDLLERVGWVEGDTVEFVSNTNGSFTVKKVVKSEV